MKEEAETGEEKEVVGWRQRAAAAAERFGFVLIPALVGWIGGAIFTVVIGYFFWSRQC